jgi:Na+-transporting NADH:ubiquinone oxidoreductase subunit F
MLEIGFGIVVFTTIVTSLAVVILLVRARLAPSGPALIVINDKREVRTVTGGKLLDALAEAGVHLPSSCGGVGTCGQCRLKVLEGAGDPLPTETSRMNRHDIGGGGRLACQVAIRGDMKVEIPDIVLGAKRWQCRVRSSQNVGSLIKEVVLELPQGEMLDFRAGDYVILDCPPYRTSFRDFEVAEAFQAVWNRLNLWRLEGVSTTQTSRAYSLANGPGETNLVRLVVRIAIPPPTGPTDTPPGVVSSYIFSLKSGDEVTISGPFGSFFATESGREMIFIGGGAGMAPMRAHILEQLEHLKSDRKISFWYGARSLQELFYQAEFDRLTEMYGNFCWHVALSAPLPEDNWNGPTGFIHEVLFREYLKGHPAPEECEYYICGPPMMVMAVRAMLDNLGIDPENIFFDDFGG